MQHQFKVSKKIKNLKVSASVEVNNLVNEMRHEGIKDIISLGAGEPDFDTPENIKRVAWEALQKGKTKYESTKGSYELREEISKKLENENEISVGVEDIIVTPGAKFAIYLTFQAVLEKGDRVLLLEPAWVSYEPAAKLAGAKIARVNLAESSGFQPDLGAIKAAMEKSVKIIVLNTPCNPSGVVYSKSIIRNIAELAAEYEALLLSDEIYEHLIFDGKHYSPGSEFENVVTVNGFSKSFAMTGWRLGYVIAPKEILEGMIKIYQHSATCVNAFAQAGAIEALRSEESRQAREQMIEEYKKRWALTKDFIYESKFLDCVASQGTFYCFPSYSFDKESVNLAKELLRKNHVATVPGSAFGECEEGHLRLSFATSRENLCEAFDRMESFFKDLVEDNNE